MLMLINLLKMDALVNTFGNGKEWNPTSHIDLLNNEFTMLTIILNEKYTYFLKVKYSKNKTYLACCCEKLSLLC